MELTTNQKKDNILLNILSKYWIIIVVIAIVFSLYINYLVASTRNVPFMDYWRYLNDLGEKIMSGDFSFKDAWISYYGQRAPLQYFLLALNMQYFGYNTQIEIFAGAIISLLIVFYLLYAFIKENHDNLSQKVKIQLLCLPFIFLVFSLNKWEIIILQFSLSFAIRILFYLGIFILLNNYLLNIGDKKNKIVVISMLSIIAICFLSSAYFVAFSGSILLVILTHFLIRYKEDKAKYLIYYICLYASIIIGIIIYSVNAGYSSGMEKAINIGEFLVNFIKGALLMFGASVFQNDNAGYTLGILIAILYIFAIILYITKKMYKKTYMPLLLILYSFINIAAIYYSRAYVFDINYLNSSRYTYETTLGLIGMLWIFASEVLSLHTTGRSKFITLTVIFLSYCIIIGGLVNSTYTQYKIGKYRGAYFENAINVLHNTEFASDNELGMLQANSSSYVRSGVNLLKKHNISIFRNQGNDDIQQNNILYEGFYENINYDVWTNGNASIRLDNENANRFHLIGYSPDTMPDNNITVTINNKESATVDMIPGSSYEVMLDFENRDGIININITTEKSFIPKNEGWNEDIRELGAYITSWNLYQKDTENIIIQKTGFYDETNNDNWISGNASIIISNKNASYFFINGYYPEGASDNRITITINKRESKTIDMFPGEVFAEEIHFENTLDFVYVDIITDKVIIPKNEGWNDDERELGAIITSWSLE